MKIITYLLAVSLIAVLGAAAFFYINMFQPMQANYSQWISNKPECEKAVTELKKYKEKERQETAWMNPVINDLSTVLRDEIKTETIEVFSSGNKVVVNIAEHLLYLPGSRTFAKESPPLLAKLDSLLRNDNVKGKNIYIGNTTQPVQAHGKGKKKLPAKDARTLAAERSAELIKYFEKKGVNADTLIAAAYSQKEPAIGFKIKGNKTMILIETPPLAPMVAPNPAAAPGAQTKPTVTTTVTATTMKTVATSPVLSTQQKPLPKPAQPKKTN